MIQATLKGEHYIKRIETPETPEETLLAEIVDIGAPTSMQELTRLTKMSTKKCEQLVKRLAKAGMIEIEPDNVALRALSSVIRKIQQTDKDRPKESASTKFRRYAIGNTRAILGTPKGLFTPKQRRFEERVLHGREQ
jgi:hypothetical protein